MSLPAVWTHLLESPLGPLGAVFDGRGGLCRLGFMPREEAAWPEGASWNGDRSFRYLLRQLEAYFRGDCRTFNVPLTLDGSAFQLRVWRMLADIPFGETLSYRELALRLGDAELARAVGQAVGANPVAILVPCHRVLGSDGALRGYAWGLERKQALLELEREVLRRATDAEAPGGDPAEAPGSCAPGLPSAPPAGPWRRPCPPAGCS